MIYGNSTATFSSKLRETTRLLRPRGRKFARARLSRSPALFIRNSRGFTAISGRVHRDHRAGSRGTRPSTASVARAPSCHASSANRLGTANGEDLFAVSTWLFYTIFYLWKSFFKSKGSSRATEIYILFFVEGVVGLVRGLILERRWWKMWLNWNVEYWNVII